MLFFLTKQYNIKCKSLQFSQLLSSATFSNNNILYPTTLKNRNVTNKIYRWKIVMPYSMSIPSFFPSLIWEHYTLAKKQGTRQKFWDMILEKWNV